MEDPLFQKNNNFFSFYKKDNGPNEISEEEINKQISKSKHKVCMSYFYQVLFIIFYLTIYFAYPFSEELFKTSTSIIKFVIWLVNLSCLLPTIYPLSFCAIMDTDEYNILSDKKECKSLIEVLQKYFYTNPKIIFSFDYNMKNELSFVNKTLSEILEYKSSLDTSGLLTINHFSPEKLYLILFVKLNVQYYGEGSKDESNLINTKIENIRKISFDNNIESKKSYTLNNINEHKYYIKVGNKEPSFFHYGYFIFFTALGLGGFYLFYVRLYIYIKEFVVRKLVNTREDLDTMKQNIRYDDRHIPGISINGKVYRFDSNLCGSNFIKEKIIENNPVSSAEFECTYKIKINN